MPTYISPPSVPEVLPTASVADVSHELALEIGHLQQEEIAERNRKREAVLAEARELARHD